MLGATIMQLQARIAELERELEAARREGESK